MYVHPYKRTTFHDDEVDTYISFIQPKLWSSIADQNEDDAYIRDTAHLPYDEQWQPTCYKAMTADHYNNAFTAVASAEFGFSKEHFPDLSQEHQKGNIVSLKKQAKQYSRLMNKSTLHSVDEHPHGIQESRAYFHNE